MTQEIKVKIMIKHEEVIVIPAEDLIDRSIEDYVSDYVDDEIYVSDSMDYEVC